jgi:hypothetical protein
MGSRSGLVGWQEGHGRACGFDGVSNAGTFVLDAEGRVLDGRNRLAAWQEGAFSITSKPRCTGFQNETFSGKPLPFFRLWRVALAT